MHSMCKFSVHLIVHATAAFSKTDWLLPSMDYAVIFVETAVSLGFVLNIRAPFYDSVYTSPYFIKDATIYVAE